MLCSCQSYIDASSIFQESNFSLIVASYSRENHEFFLSSLPTIYRPHVLIDSQGRQIIFQLLDLPLIGRYKPKLLFIIVILQHFNQLHYNFWFAEVDIGLPVMLLFTIMVYKEQRLFFVKKDVFDVIIPILWSNLIVIGQIIRYFQEEIVHSELCRKHLEVRISAHLKSSEHWIAFRRQSFIDRSKLHLVANKNNLLCLFDSHQGFNFTSLCCFIDNYLFEPEFF